MIARLKKYLSCGRFVCFGIVAISVISLGSALTAEHVFGLKPCALCIYQRIPFVITALLGIIGLIASIKFKREKLAALLVFIAGIVFLNGAAIAFYHSGVELHWWVSFLEGCKVDFNAAMDPSKFLAIIEDTQAVRCDEIPWADPILGLSMANYNALMSLGLGLGCSLSALLITRKANGF